MDPKETATLIELAIQSLLSNEPAAIQALEQIPRELFVPLFNAAFLGGHKNILIAMVKIWPFPCLHIGTLSVQEPQRELLKIMIENLQVLPTQNSAFWSPKLRILDLRQDAVCRNVCPVFYTKSLICFHSCSYTEHSAMKVEAQCSTVNAECEGHSSRQSMQLIVDLSLDGSLRERDFVSFILTKVEQSSGSLHLCCRDLQIGKFSDYKSTMSFLSLKCIDHLAVERASLTEVLKILSQVVHLHRLCLSKITCRSLNGKVFKYFINHLKRMNHLKEFNLSSFYLTDHLSQLLRVLPHGIDLLGLPFCGLSNRDFRFLSQCPQTNHLKMLNLSNNQLYWEDCEPFRDLLEKVSGSLVHLEVDHCMLTDSTMSVILPALTHCCCLSVLSFTSNPITMPMLTIILQQLTPLLKLKYVIYPIPVHCYGIWHFHDSLDLQKLAAVQTELKMLLELAERKDMHWITYSE